MKAFLKLLLGALAGPLAIALLLVLAAVALHFARRQRLARAFAVLALLVALLGSMPWVGDAFLSPLEKRFPAFDPSAQLTEPIAAIAVLGSWYNPHDGLPVTSALDADGLARISEGVRLLRQFPAAQLIVSGDVRGAGAPPAVGYLRYALEMGVPRERIVVITGVYDTAGEARAISSRLSNKQFVLVTTASHMPRAVGLMIREGLAPLPAPTAHLTGSGFELRDWRFMLVPCALGLAKTEAAWHEYLGLAAISLGLD